MDGRIPYQQPPYLASFFSANDEPSGGPTAGTTIQGPARAAFAFIILTCSLLPPSPTLSGGGGYAHPAGYSSDDDCESGDVVSSSSSAHTPAPSVLVSSEKVSCTPSCRRPRRFSATKYIQLPCLRLMTTLYIWQDFIRAVTFGASRARCALRSLRRTLGARFIFIADAGDSPGALPPEVTDWAAELGTYLRARKFLLCLWACARS